MPPFRRNAFCVFCDLGFIFSSKTGEALFPFCKNCKTGDPPFLKHSKNQSPLLEKLRGRQGRGASGRQGRGSSGRRFRFFILFGIFFVEAPPFFTAALFGRFFRNKNFRASTPGAAPAAAPPKAAFHFFTFSPLSFPRVRKLPRHGFFEFWVWKTFPHPFSPPLK